MRADILDRAALRRAFRGCDVVYHTAGVRRVQAAGAGLGDQCARRRGGGRGRGGRGRAARVVVTSSVAGDRPGAAGQVGTEEDLYRGGRADLRRRQARGRGRGARGRRARLGVEVVVVNPSYVFGAPVDPREPGETSNADRSATTCAGACRRSSTAETNAVDVRDVAAGHLLRGRSAASRASATCSAGHDIALGRADRAGGAAVRDRAPRLVRPPARDGRARPAAETLARPAPDRAGGVRLMAAELALLVAQGAKRELGYRRARPGTRRSRDTVAWYLELIEDGRVRRRAPSPCRWRPPACGWPSRVGLLGGLRTAERYVGPAGCVRAADERPLLPARRVLHAPRAARGRARARARRRADRRRGGARGRGDRRGRATSASCAATRRPTRRCSCCARRARAARRLAAAGLRRST